MTLPLVVVRGDGVGPEVVDAALVAASPLLDGFELVEARMGLACYRETGSALPADTLEMLQDGGLALLGAVQTPPNADYRSPLLRIRRELDLFANLRPVRDLRGGPVDLVVVRENLECLYAGLEGGNEDTALAIRVITRQNCERISRFALELARDRPENHRTVTCVHKANVLARTCGLFRDTFTRVSGDYPDVPVDELHADVCAMRMVMEPGSMDVLVTTNMFGDILSDLAAGLVGGLGTVPSGNIGERYAVFEPVHGAAPDIAGKGVANPAAAILSLAMLLERTGDVDGSRRLSRAVEACVLAGETTPDLGGSLGTDAVAMAVLRRLETGAVEG